MQLQVYLLQPHESAMQIALARLTRSERLAETEAAAQWQCIGWQEEAELIQFYLKILVL
jgi:hypothetical protein